MSLVAKSRPEINIKEVVGEFEFNVVPKSMFAADGSILHCSCKSALMGILEKLKDHQAHEIPPLLEPMTVAEVQALDKPSWVKNCVHLAQHFTACVFAKHGESDEVRLIFDR